MRWSLILLAVGTLLTLGFVAVAQPPSTPARCTALGTPQRDIMTGTTGRDVLCGLAGNDYLHGDGGRDILWAGAGDDVLAGAGGKDAFHGSGGNDRIFAVDDHGGERIYGGAGVDQCYVDRGDRTIGCEQTFRGIKLPVVRALTRQAFNLMVIADASPATATTTVVLPPVLTITTTQTVTKTASFPPCTPPPPTTPSPC